APPATCCTSRSATTANRSTRWPICPGARPGARRAGNPPREAGSQEPTSFHGEMPHVRPHPPHRACRTRRRLAACVAGPGHARVHPRGRPCAVRPRGCLCQREGGRLWGHSLCGPILVVEPGTRRVLASRADDEGRLHEENGVFAGTLPADQNAAFTAFDWAGVRWTQLLWPLPGDDARQDVLLA